MAILNGCNHPCIRVQSYSEGWEKTVLNRAMNTSWHVSIWKPNKNGLCWPRHAYHTCYLSELTVHLEKQSLICSKVLSFWYYLSDNIWYFFCPLSTKVPVLMVEPMPYMKPFCTLLLQKRQLHDEKMAPKTCWHKSITDTKLHKTRLFHPFDRHPVHINSLSNCTATLYCHHTLIKMIILTNVMSIDCYKFY